MRRLKLSSHLFVIMESSLLTKDTSKLLNATKKVTFYFILLVLLQDTLSVDMKIFNPLSFIFLLLDLFGFLFIAKPGSPLFNEFWVGFVPIKDLVWLCRLLSFKDGILIVLISSCCQNHSRCRRKVWTFCNQSLGILCFSCRIKSYFLIIIVSSWSVQEVAITSMSRLKKIKVLLPFTMTFAFICSKLFVSGWDLSTCVDSIIVKTFLLLCNLRQTSIVTGDPSEVYNSLVFFFVILME